MFGVLACQERNAMKGTIVHVTIALCCLLMQAPGFVHAKRGLALVIGNSGYNSSPLHNSVNDVEDISTMLERLDFHVILKKNADLRTMDTAIRDFGPRLAGFEVGLFYYAGHAMQIEDGNYLIPVHNRIAGEMDVKYESVHMGRILDAMQTAGNGLNIVILDACRNNPFARKFRSMNRGLARMDAPTGTLVAYATSPGKVALDGEGRNSPYTAALLKYMAVPDLSIEQLFKRVRIDLNRRTGGRQIPWEATCLTGDFYFRSGNEKKQTVANAGAILSSTAIQQERMKLEREREELEQLKRMLEERKRIEEQRQKLLSSKTPMPENQKPMKGKLRIVLNQRRGFDSGDESLKLNYCLYNDKGNRVADGIISEGDNSYERLYTINRPGEYRIELIPGSRIKHNSAYYHREGAVSRSISIYTGKTTSVQADLYRPFIGYPKLENVFVSD